MEFVLSPEQRAMVETVRAVSQERIKPRAMKYLDGTFPWENISELAEIGVLGMAVPEEYGGLGLPVLDTALVLEEIAKGCYVHRDGGDGRGRRADADHRQLRAGAHQAPASCPASCTGEYDPRRLHDRAARRHRRRELPHQHRRSRATSS